MPFQPLLDLGPEPSLHDLLDTSYPEDLHFFSALCLIEMVSRLNLSVARFFSHQNDSAVVATYQELRDVDYARERLVAYASKRRPLFPRSTPGAAGSSLRWARRRHILASDPDSSTSHGVWTRCAY